MVKQLFKGFLIALFIAGLIAGCGRGRDKEKKNVAVIKPRVKAETVLKTKIVETISFTGILAAWQQANLAPSIPGRVKKIYVKEGDRVKTGQLLAVMDKTQMETIQSQHDLAKTNYYRMKKLRDAGAVSQSQFEQTELAYKQAQIGLSSSQENTRITAPFRGVITAVTREAGEIYSGMSIGPGASGLIQVADIRRMKMDIMVSERAVVKLKKGQGVDLYMDVLPDKKLTGKIHWINPAADPLSRTFKVRVAVTNPESGIRPGFYGKAVIHIQEKVDALVVPSTAVIDGKYCFIVDKEGKARRSDVRTGLSNEEQFEILEGLAEGDNVVVKGNRGLADGVEVEIVEQ
jgi:membrane fusion protein (multidrug efflux system)